VHVKRVADPADFLSLAVPFLARDEARHNLALGIAGVLCDQPAHYPTHDLRIVERVGRVVAVGLRTPPFNLLVAGSDPEALHRLADGLHEEAVDLPGVTAAVPEVEAFASRWVALTGMTLELRRRQRIYRLARVVPARPTSGAARAATDADRELLVAWVTAFVDEIGETAMRSAEATVDARLAGGGFTLWEDRGAPVSLAGWGSPTPSGIRVGPVYTPPDHRGRGYGSSVTAAASAEQLAAGRTFCFLYTDLTNPTSNKIYVDIGYEPVCDSLEYRFVMP
jgi:predicted GNAT family acetyltransferase